MINKWFGWLFNAKKISVTEDLKSDESYDNHQDLETPQSSMTPTRPYILKAFYDWIVANNCTPHIVVMTDIKGVQVPKSFIQDDNTIILNLAPSAIRDLEIKNHSVSFLATFSGQVQELYIPMEAVTSIFAKENHRGMIFEQEDFTGVSHSRSKNKKSGFTPKLVVSNEEEH